MNSTCKFFQWADEANTSSNFRGGDDDDHGGGGGGGWNGCGRDWSGLSAGRGRGRGGSSGASKKPRATGTKRKCGVCGIEGELDL